MVKKKITQNTLRKHLKPAMREAHAKQIIRDTELAGFNLVVNKGNTGTWWIQFRPKGKTPDGKRWPYKSIKIGDTGTHSVEEARDAGRVIKAAVIQGRDPHAEAINEREEIAREKNLQKSLTDVLIVYQTFVDDRTDISESYRASEKLYAGKAVSALNDGVLSDIRGLDAINAFKTAHGSQHARKHMESAFGRLMDYCLSKGWLDINPMACVPKNQKVKRGAARKVVLTLDELAALYVAADAESDVVRDMVRVMLLIPARAGTVAKMEHSEINLKTKLWIQPPHKTKNNDGITLPLTENIIELLSKHKGKGLMFPSGAGTPFTSWGKLKQRLSDRADLDYSQWRFHDFRRSFVSTLAEIGHDETVLDLILNHSASATRGGVLGVYQTSLRMTDRRKALNDWSELLFKKIVKIK